MPSLSLFLQEICHKFHYWNGNFHLYQMINVFCELKIYKTKVQVGVGGAVVTTCWVSASQSFFGKDIGTLRVFSVFCIFSHSQLFFSLFSRFHFLFLMRLCFMTRVKNIWIKLCVYVFFYTGLNASKIRTVWFIINTIF